VQIDSSQYSKVSGEMYDQFLWHIYEEKKDLDVVPDIYHARIISKYLPMRNRTLRKDQDMGDHH
jgi:hypothetical protein